MRWDYDENGPTVTLEQALANCSKWLQARKKRKNTKENITKKTKRKYLNILKNMLKHTKEKSQNIEKNMVENIVKNTKKNY